MKQYKDLTEEQMQWIEANEVAFKVSLRLTPDRIQNIFNYYNHITGETKKVSGCGRCIDNTKNLVYAQYKKQKGI